MYNTNPSISTSSSNDFARHGARPLTSSGCAAMTVMYLTCIEESSEGQVCEQIKIMIQGEQGTFDVT